MSNNTPLGALGNVDRAMGREMYRVRDEQIGNNVSDLNSIATAIDQGGFLGGAIQALDCFSVGHQVSNVLDSLNIIPENQAMKETVSGGINMFLGGGGLLGLLAMKDFSDAAAAGNAKGPMPPSQSALPPGQAMPPDSGYPVEGSPDMPGVSEANLQTIQIIVGGVDQLRIEVQKYKEANPGAPLPGDGEMSVDDMLMDENMPVAELYQRLAVTIVNQRPELIGELAEANNVEVPAPPTDAPPAAEGAGPFAQILGAAGGVMGFLGPILSNPITGMILGAACMAIPPLEVLAPILPKVLPVVGQAMTMAAPVVSGMASEMGGTPGAGGAPTPDMLSGLTSAIPGMLSSLPAI